MKLCVGCGIVFPFSEFYRDTTTRDQLTRLCRECHKAAYRERYARKLEQYQEKSRRYHHAHRETEIAKMREYYRRRKAAKTEAA